MIEKLKELHPARFFLETWRLMDEEAANGRKTRVADGLGYDYRPLIVLCVGAVLLTLMEYFGGGRTFTRLLEFLSNPTNPGDFWTGFRISQFNRLYEFGWWASCRVLGYFLLPVLVLKLMGESVRDHGLETKGFLTHAWIYAIAFVVVLLCVIAVSFTEEFSTYYPFYKRASRSWFDFAAWELMYAAQFFSLEFFFRGFWLRACKTMMGSHAIFAMIVPYCMIHYGKPWLEALAAIAAGLFLGTLAMKTRSIWSGFLIHVSVAVSMDVAALLQTSHLPERAWPLP